MLVRKARADDIEEILDLLEAVAEEGWLATEPPVDRAAKTELYRETLKRHDAAMFVAEHDGKITGEIGIEGSGVAHVGMYVGRDSRGQGAGRALLEHAIEWARSNGIHKISLEVWPHNEAALRLYESAGFTREGQLRSHYRRKNGELWDAVLMGLVLVDNDGRSA